MLFETVKGLVGIPVIVDANSPQVENSLGTRQSPTHAGPFHSILDEMAASAFDDTRADGPASSQIRTVVHVGQIATVVADGGFEDLASKGYSCPSKIPEIHNKLQAPAIPVADWQVRVSQRRMLVLVELLAIVATQIKAYEKRLTELLDQHEDAFIFRSLPNIGDVTAAWLLGKVGDCRDKFESASGLQAQAGSCPVTVQSNKQRRIKFRVACCKSFRNGLQ